MSSRNEWENMNRPRKALVSTGCPKGAQPIFQPPLVNHHSQEYHAPSVFTSHVADILKLRSSSHWAAYCLEEGFHEGNLSFYWPERPPRFDTCIGVERDCNFLYRLQPRRRG